MRDLAGKVALVTGGASGLGLALARVLGREGVKLGLVDLRRERLDEAVSELRREGASAIGVELDVTDRVGYRNVADEIEARLGPVQLLFNNAGVGAMGPLAEASYEDWDWILGVNLGGVVNGLCTVLPRMRARGHGGHVISTASAAGLFASDGLGVYVAAKMAVVGVMEVLRAELVADGIGVSVICPHLMRTHIHEHANLRPARYATSDSSAEAAVAAALRIEAQTAAGMDPLDVAEHTLKAIRENRLYVIPYPELRGILRSRFAALDRAIPHSEPDPARVQAEAGTLSFAPYLEAFAESEIAEGK